MSIRQPFRAGGFYEADPAQCRRHAERLLAADLPPDTPPDVRGGIVPHAGWVYSGPLAARTIRAVAAAEPATVVLFGADHWGAASLGEVYDAGAWISPLGAAAVDGELAVALLAASALLRANGDAHAREHSIEVQVPLIQCALPAARIVPIEVPPTPAAVEIGQAVGTLLAEQFPCVRVLGSTDLTHHGGHFGHVGGRGEEGAQWTRQNDRRMLDRIEAMDAEGVIVEAAEHHNACGAGAIAATIAACGALGATRGVCLGYDDSFAVTHAHDPDDPDDTTVGYASVVFA